jgi:glycosyltransferase involved in cell wall biosynthesis
MYALDIIVPFYNEEHYLEESVARLLNANVHNEIYLVNNNSTDSSKEIAISLSQKYNSVSYVESSQQAGKGVALRAGLEKIQGSHVVIHDADLEYFPDDLRELKKISIKNKEDLILGSRFIGNKKRKNSYRRTFYANKLLSLFFSMLYNYKVTDIASCYKLLPINIIKEFQLTENGFAVEVEILANFLKTKNAVIHELPIQYIGRTYKQGKKITIFDGFKYIYASIVHRF